MPKGLVFPFSFARNDGAKHKGPWSRLDVQKNPAGFGRFALSALTAKLPPQANTFYFRDEIGNISTSNIRSAAVTVTSKLCNRCSFSHEKVAAENLSCQAKHSCQGLISLETVFCGLAANCCSCRSCGLNKLA